MWKITINLSPCPCLSHSLHWFANPSVHDTQALSDVNINNSWRNGLPPPWPHVRIPWGPWNPYTQATLRTGEVRVQASVFFRLPDDSSVQPNLKTSVLVGSLCFSGSYISSLFYNIKKESCVGSFRSRSLIFQSSLLNILLIIFLNFILISLIAMSLPLEV